MLRIKFRTEPRGVLESVRAGLGAATLEVNAVLSVGETEWMTFLTATECRNGPDEALGSIDAVELLYDHPAFGSTDTWNVVAVVTGGRFTPQTLAGLRAIPHTVRFRDRTVAGVVTVRDWAHLQSVANDIEEVHGRFELVSVTQVDRVGSLLGADGFRHALRKRLTANRIELLETAYRMGYFVVPREASATEVAGRLGVSQSTFSEQLRRALCDLLAVGLGYERPASEERSVTTDRR